MMPRLSFSRLWTIVLLVPLSIQAQEALISPFDGSETIGSYETRFAELPLLVSPLGERNIPAVQTFEGALTSHIYTRPEGVEAFEVYSSYRDALEQGGFEIMLDCRAPDCNLKLSVMPTYQRSGVIGNRDYGRLPTSTVVYLVGWPEHYLSARKTLADRTYHAMVLVSGQRGLYSVDILESAERVADTVTLSEALLSARLENEGRSVLDGIYFETGQAVIKPESGEALEVITAYLKSDPDSSYYVVGHTDDTGDLQGNLLLSRERAAAVTEALSRRGIDSGRLVAEGAGPYAPVASNRTETGRAVNRRVELVLRLQ